MSKRTNLDIQDAACLHIIHNLQHSTSRPTTQSMQTSMVNAVKKIFSPLPANRYGKSTMWSTQRCHHANEGNSGMEEETVQALGALRSLRSKKSLQRRNEVKHTSQAMKRKRNGLRIMLRERPLGQESEKMTQRQQFSKTRTI
jgi:hypothetical protein